MRMVMVYGIQGQGQSDVAAPQPVGRQGIEAPLHQVGRHGQPGGY